MPGALVPSAGAIGNDTVTNAQQETNFENLAEALRRMMGVGTASVVTTVIAAGVATPNGGVVVIDTEGGAPTDNLDQISPAAYVENSVILLVPASAGSRNVTVRYLQGGSGQFLLSTAASFTLNTPFSYLLLRHVGGFWIEIGRGYGSDMAAFRTFLGLGTAAVLNNGAVNAATLQGNAASFFLPAAGTAANSTLFAGLAASAFLRSDLASLQTIAGSLRAASGRLEAATVSGAGTALLGLFAGGFERSQVYFDGVSGHLIMRLLDTGGAVQAGIRFRPSLIPDYWNGTTWVPFFSISTPAPWIQQVRWDKLDAIANYTGTGETILYTTDLPISPNSGASRTYRISAGITGERGSGNAEFRVRVYIGDNGNTTDAMVYNSAQQETPIDGVLYLAEMPEDDFTVTAGTKVTLVLRKDNSNSINIQPSVANTYTMTKRTYLRVEQIA